MRAREVPVGNVREARVVEPGLLDRLGKPPQPEQRHESAFRNVAVQRIKVPGTREMIERLIHAAPAPQRISKRSVRLTRAGPQPNHGVKVGLRLVHVLDHVHCMESARELRLRQLGIDRQSALERRSCRGAVRRISR